MPEISQEQEQQLRAITKRCPSREKANQVARIGLSLDGYDAELIAAVAEYLLDVRQVLRGGKRTLSGGSKWPSDSGKP